MQTNLRTRTHELLADQAVQPLEAAELSELESLLERFPELDDDSFHLSAAAIELAANDLETSQGTLPPATELPEMLRRRILRDGRRIAPQVDDAFEPAPVVSLRDRKRAFFLPRWLGVAAAAVLFVAGSWFVHDANTPIETQCILERFPQFADLEDPRRSLMAELDVVHASWTPAQDLAGPTPIGDLVWSSTRQQGILTLHGLTSEQLASSTLHLWIVEHGSGSRPIDGGAFTVDAEGQARMTIALEGGPVEPVRFLLTIDAPDTTPAPENPVLVASLGALAGAGAV